MNEPAFIRFLPAAAGIALVCAAAAGVALALRARERPWSGRLLLAVIPFAAWVWLTAAARQVLYVPYTEWNGLRLAQSVAFFRGYQLYYVPGEGPVMATDYGPVKAATYFPAAFARTPTGALVLAGVVAAAIYHLPVLWFLAARVRRGRTPPSSALALFLLFGFLSVTSPALLSVAYAVMADAGAVGLAAAACVLLVLRGRAAGVVTYAACGLLAGCAAWSKQNLLPVQAGLALFAWGLKGWREGLKCALVLGLVNALVAGVFVVSVGWRELYFNLCVSAFSSPWSYMIKLLARAGIEFSGETLPAVILLLVSLLLCRRETAPPPDVPSLRPWIARNEWILPAAVAALLIPGAVLGRSIEWGDINHHAVPMYFLILASVLLLDGCADRTCGRADAAGACGLSVLLLVVLSVLHLPAGFTAATLIRKWEDTPQQQAYRAALAHPGEIYFPRHPLATLFAENRLDHTEDGVRARRMAGFPLSDDYFATFLPPRMRYVATFVDWKIAPLKSRVAEYSHRVSLPELPGWTVYAKEPVDRRP